MRDEIQEIKAIARSVILHDDALSDIWNRKDAIDLVRRANVPPEIVEAVADEVLKMAIAFARAS